VPREGQPIAVIPEIGGPGMELTWVTDIRTWPAPRPADDGPRYSNPCPGGSAASAGRWAASRWCVCR
jgi:hypothetical protein